MVVLIHRVNPVNSRIILIIANLHKCFILEMNCIDTLHNVSVMLLLQHSWRLISVCSRFVQGCICHASVECLGGRKHFSSATKKLNCYCVTVAVIKHGSIKYPSDTIEPPPAVFLDFITGSVISSVG